MYYHEFLQKVFIINMIKSGEYMYIYVYMYIYMYLILYLLIFT